MRKKTAKHKIDESRDSFWGAHQGADALQATPVNNRFVDLKTNLRLPMREMPEKSIEKVNFCLRLMKFSGRKGAFNTWSKLVTDVPQMRCLRHWTSDFLRCWTGVTIASFSPTYRKIL